MRRGQWLRVEGWCWFNVRAANAWRRQQAQAHEQRLQSAPQQNDVLTTIHLCKNVSKTSKMIQCLVSLQTLLPPISINSADFLLLPRTLWPLLLLPSWPSEGSSSPIASQGRGQQPSKCEIGSVHTSGTPRCELQACAFPILNSRI